MAKGYLTMFEDPVVGPQLAMGLLSTGLGLLTSPPNQVGQAIQGGVGLMSQGLLYGGKQRLLEQKAQEKLDRQTAAAADFRRVFGGGQMPEGPSQAPQAGPPPPMYDSGAGAPPWAPTVPQAAGPAGPGPSSMGRIPPEAAMLMEQVILHPDQARAFGPAITQLMQPRELSKVDEMRQINEYVESVLGPEGAKRKQQIDWGYIPKPVDVMKQDALSQYWQQQEARRSAASAAANTDRDARLAWEKSKPAAFDLNAARAEAEPGSEEYKRMARIKAGLEPRATNSTPIYNDKGEVTGYLGGGGKPLSVEQSKAVSFAMRAANADKVLKEIEESGYRPGIGTQVKQAAGASTGAPDRLLDATAQRYEQAKREFTTAILRKDSGATITSPEQVDANLQYYANPGDEEENITQKVNSRSTAIEGITVQAGPGQATLKAREAGTGNMPAKGFQGASKQGAPAVPAGTTKEQLEKKMRERGLL